MSDKQIISPEKTASDETAKSEVSASCGGLKAKLKKISGHINAALDYIDEEVPEPPESADAPKSIWKKLWTDFNSFLDSLEAILTRPEQKKGSENGRAGLLKSAGGFCWTVILVGTVLIFLFAATLLGTVKTMEYIAEHRVSFYPAPEVMQYLASEHEELESVADRLASPNAWPMARDDFDATTLDTLKPIGFSRDDYGVYIVTSREWYAGEHGIFIAYDAEKMPPKLNWGLIKGRVFTYAIFEGWWP